MKTTSTGRLLYSLPTLAEAIEAAGGQCQGSRPAGRCDIADLAVLVLVADPEAGPIVLCPSCLAGRRALLSRMAAATGTGSTARRASRPTHLAAVPAPPRLGGGA